MPLDFSQKGPEPRSRRRRPPPDYSSRGVQFRLFAILAALMVITLVMSRVRDPGFWQFLGLREPSIAGGPPLTDAEIANKFVDTRVNTPRDDERKDTLPIAGSKSSQWMEVDVMPATGTAGSSEQIAWEHGWSTILNEMKPAERTLLFQVARAGRDGAKLTDEQIAEWLFLADKLDTEWRRYRDEARQSVVDLPADEQADWEAVITNLETHWSTRYQPLLAGIAAGATVAENSRQTLADLQATLDVFALAAILDGTVDRPQEKEAWFRLWEQLQVTDAQTLRGKSLGPIGFLQLYEQPKDYRGKLVTVRGTVQQAYHVSERQNPHGISGYYVFTLRPAGGPPRPMIIYTLELPPGFPKVADRDLDKTITTLHEDVEFTGYFFKKWAYQAKDGINLAPLLLAKSPRWDAPALSSLSDPSPLGLTLIVAACAAGAIALVAWWFRKVW